MRMISARVGLMVWALAAPAMATTNVLYDGSVGGGSQTPSNQGFVYAYVPFPPFGTNLATQSAAGGLTTLTTTTQRSDHAGYFSYFPSVPLVPFSGQHPNMPASLDRTTGFSVDFTLK